MKEEMAALYELRDYNKALAGWKLWLGLLRLSGQKKSLRIQR
jgi:hypothetical protein